MRNSFDKYEYEIDAEVDDAGRAREQVIHTLEQHDCEVRARSILEIAFRAHGLRHFIVILYTSDGV